MAESTREGMPPIIIFKGQVYSPDNNYLHQWGAGTPVEDKWEAHQCPGHLVNLFRMQHPVPKGTHESIHIPSEIRANRIR